MVRLCKLNEADPSSKPFCAAFNLLLSSFIIQLLYSFRYPVAVIISCRAQESRHFLIQASISSMFPDKLAFFLVSGLISEIYKVLGFSMW